jgi:serine/threonine-protein kinase
MDMYRGIDPSPKLTLALAAADRAREAAPQDSVGHTKKAFAYFFVMYFRQGQQKVAEAKALAEQVIQSAEAALRIDPKDAFAYDVMGNAYISMGIIAGGVNEQRQQFMKKAIEYLSRSIMIAPWFVWAYNDLGTAYLFNGILAQTKTDMKVKEIDAAVTYFSKAMAIDPEYVNAVNNLSGALAEKSSILAEHGNDPSGYLQQIRNLNPRSEKSSLFSLGNLAGANIAAANYLRYKGDNYSAVLSEASDCLKQLISLNGSMAQPYWQLAEIAYRMAMMSENELPSALAQIAFGRSNIKKCYSIEATNSDCRSVELMLDVYERTMRLGSLAGGKGDRTLTQRIQSIHVDAEQSQQALVNYAEAIWVATQWKSLSRQPLYPELSMGLRVTERIAAMTDGLPHASALRGAFLVLESRSLVDAQLKRRQCDEAWNSFERAFRGNPLLRRAFGDLAEEARRGRGG